MTLLMLGGVAAAFGLSRWRDLRSWKAAAKRLGLAFDGYPFSGPHLSGRRDGFEIDVSPREDRRVEGATLTVRGVADQLSLEAETLWTRTIAPDFLVGDAEFDHRMRIRGAPSRLLAVLDADTRRRALQLLGAGRGKVDGGRLVVQLGSVAEVEARLEEVLALAGRLELLSEEIPQRLLERVRTEPEAAVRVRCLRALLATSSPQAAVAADFALSAPRTDLRLEAAQLVVAKGRPSVRHAGDRRLARWQLAVETLASLIEAPLMPAPSRCLALATLSGAGAPEVALPALERALRSPEPSLQRTAIEEVGRLRHRSAAGRLRELAKTADDATAEAIARALGLFADPAAEPTLVRLLARDDPGVVLSAIEAIERLGTVAAVEPLLELRGRFAVGRQAQAAERAIRAIQARVSGAEPGQLSLVEPEELAGALSLVGPRPEGGEVSLIEEEAEAGARLGRPDPSADTRGRPRM